MAYQLLKLENGIPALTVRDRKFYKKMRNRKLRYWNKYEIPPYKMYQGYVV